MKGSIIYNKNQFWHWPFITQRKQLFNTVGFDSVSFLNTFFFLYFSHNLTTTRAIKVSRFLVIMVALGWITLLFERH